MKRLRGLALGLLAGCATAGEGGEAVRFTLEIFEFDAGHEAAVDRALAGRDPAAAVPEGGLAFIARPDFPSEYRSESMRFRSRRTNVQSIRLALGREGLLQLVEHDSVRADLGTSGGSGVVLTGAGLALRPVGRSAGSIDLEITPWFQVLRGPTLRATERTARLRVPAGRAVVLASRDAGDPLVDLLLFSRTPRGPRRSVAVLVAD